MTYKPAVLQPSFSVLCSPCLVLCLYPLPSLTLALVHSCPHCLSLPLPSAITAASSCQYADTQYQHTSIYASPGSHLHILKHLRTWPFSLSLSLSCHLGTSPNLACRHHSALQHHQWESITHLGLHLYHPNPSLKLQTVFALRPIKRLPACREQGIRCYTWAGHTLWEGLQWDLVVMVPSVNLEKKQGDMITCKDNSTCLTQKCHLILTTSPSLPNETKSCTPSNSLLLSQGTCPFSLFCAYLLTFFALSVVACCSVPCPDKSLPLLFPGVSTGEYHLSPSLYPNAQYIPLPQFLPLSLSVCSPPSQTVCLFFVLFFLFCSSSHSSCCPWCPFDTVSDPLLAFPLCMLTASHGFPPFSCCSSSAQLWYVLFFLAPCIFLIISCSIHMSSCFLSLLPLCCAISLLSCCFTLPCCGSPYLLHLHLHPCFLAAFRWAHLCPLCPYLLLQASLAFYFLCSSKFFLAAFHWLPLFCLCLCLLLHSIHSIPSICLAPCHLICCMLPISPPPTLCLFYMFFHAQLHNLLATNSLLAACMHVSSACTTWQAGCTFCAGLKRWVLFFRVFPVLCFAHPPDGPCAPYWWAWYVLCSW